MKILENGYFNYGWRHDHLAKGLRPKAKTPRNAKLLEQASNAIGQDGVLSSLPAPVMNALFTNVDIDLTNFPYPQLFVTEKHIICCNEDSILELQDGAFVHMLGGFAVGDKWNIASAYDFVYLSNNVVTVIRDPGTKTYSVDSTVPEGSAACNFNGQFIIGVTG